MKMKQTAWVIVIGNMNESSERESSMNRCLQWKSRKCEADVPMWYGRRPTSEETSPTGAAVEEGRAVAITCAFNRVFEGRRAN